MANSQNKTNEEQKPQETPVVSVADRKQVHNTVESRENLVKTVSSPKVTYSVPKPTINPKDKEGVKDIALWAGLLGVKDYLHSAVMASKSWKKGKQTSFKEYEDAYKAIGGI